MSWKSGLSKADLSILADFYETDYYKTLERALKVRKDNLGGQAIGAPDLEYLRRLQGQSQTIDETLAFLRSNHSEQRAKDKPV